MVCLLVMVGMRADWQRHSGLPEDSTKWRKMTAGAEATRFPDEVKVFRLRSARSAGFCRIVLRELPRKDRRMRRHFAARADLNAGNRRDARLQKNRANGLRVKSLLLSAFQKTRKPG